MEGTKPRTVSSLGMFDLLKGAGMLTIVLAHTSESYSLPAANATSLAVLLPFIYRETLMAAFFIASGYGFRKRSIHKCIEQQVKGLLKPYLITALCTCALHLLVHYHTFHYWPSSLYETYKVAGGFFLGLPHTATYFGQVFFSAGPMWYMLALMVGWVMLDCILNIFPERYTNWAVAGCALLGWGTSLVWELPFCLTQGMVIVPYLYIGFLAKKHHWLEHPLSRRAKIVLGAATVGIALGALLTQSTDSVSMAHWTLGPVSILLDGMVGYLFIRMFLRWNKGNGPVVRWLETAGRRSLYIFCVHTVELIAIPWYLFAARFAEQPLLGFVLQFAVSWGTIWAVCALLVRRRELQDKLFPARRKKVYASRH